LALAEVATDKEKEERAVMNREKGEERREKRSAESQRKGFAKKTFQEKGENKVKKR
jgi:hypothetical protein